MPSSKPRIPNDPLYRLLREGRGEEFNRLRKPSEPHDFRGCDFRGVDLRDIDAGHIDFSDCYFRQADLRGLDLRSCALEGASLHAAHVSGAYFPTEISAAEIQMSVTMGTRLRRS